MLSREQYFPMLSTLIIGGGIALLPLMPIGVVVGTSTWTFFALSVLATLLFAAATLLALILPLTLWKESPRLALTTFILALTFVAFSALFAAAPPTAKDALTHHLAVPLWWSDSEKIYPIRWHEWSFYPMLVQLSFILPLSKGLTWYPAALHAAFGIILAGIVGGYLRRTANANAALLGYAILLTSPAVLRLSTEPLVDLPLAVFVTLAASIFALQFQNASYRGGSLFAAIALGLALGVKYNAILALLSIVAFLFVVGCRKGFSSSLSLTLTTSLIAGALFLPWALKNILWIGNPLYPLLKGTFGPFTSVPGPPMLKPLEHRAIIYGEEWWEIASLPIRILLWGEDGNPRLFDGILSPLFLSALALIILRGRRDASIAFLGLTAVSYLCLAVFLGSARVRYLSPIYGVLSILTSLALVSLSQLRWGKILSIAAVSGHIALGIFYAGNFMRDSRIVQYHFGSISREEFLSSSIPEYELISVANREIPPSSHVYFLSTSNPFYYLDARSFSGGYMSTAPLIRWIRSSHDSSALARELHAKGIEYLFAHTERLRKDMHSQLKNPNDVRTWNDFQAKHLLPVAQRKGFSLWRVE